MEYNGWRLYKNVIIVEEGCTTDSKAPKAPKAYIVDPSNKRQLKSAKEWARKYVYNNNTKQSTVYEGKEYLLENNGFTLELSESPSGSWRGGKLSFCMCTIKKDGHTWTTGINSDLLIELLKQTDCLKGVVQGNIAFARKNGQVGIVLIGSKSYNEAVKDDEIRKNASKTSKAKLGYEHKALQVNNVWMLDIYDWTTELDAYAISEGRLNSYWHNTINVKIPYIKIDKPIKKHVFPSIMALKYDTGYIDSDGNILENKIKTAGEILVDSANNLRDKIASGACRYSRSIPIISEYSSYQLTTKFPARAIGNQIMLPDISLGQWKEYKMIVGDCLSEHQIDDRKANKNYINKNNIKFLIGMTLTDQKDELPNIDTVRKWVEDCDCSLIVDYFGEIIKSKHLEERIKRHELFNLKLPEIDKNKKNQI